MRLPHETDLRANVQAAEVDWRNDLLVVVFKQQGFLLYQVGPPLFFCFRGGNRATTDDLIDQFQFKVTGLLVLEEVGVLDGD